MSNHGRNRRAILSALAVGLAVISQPHAVLAACPDDLVDCFGKACQYTVVADKFTLSSVLPWSSIVDGGVCAAFGSIRGNSQESAEVRNGDVFFHTTLRKKAASFGGRKVAGLPAADSVLIQHDLVSNGKPFAGLDYATVSGAIDTSGTHPGLADCVGAFADVQAASDYFRALPPNQTFGKIAISPNQVFTITITNPGLAVINIESIKMRTTYSQLTGFSVPLLSILPHAETTGVVLNVAKNVVISNHGEISFPSMLPPISLPLILNAYGNKAHVSSGPESYTDALTLVPRGTSKVGKFSYSFGHFAKTAVVHGVTYKPVVCE